MSTSYVCVDFAPPQNGYVPCKTWAVQQSLLQDIAITKQQAFEISYTLAFILLLIKGYKLLVIAFKSI